MSDDYCFGVKDREKVVREGEFHCHRCDTTRPYLKKELGQWFTLFFLPIFRVSQKRNFLECGVCHRSYLPNETKVHS